jgi:DNA-binding CsgD family transcriptional regulator
LPRKDWALGFEPRAIVTLHAPGGIGAVRREQLRNLFGFTQAEAEIAIMTAEGTSREEIASARGAAVNTVSSQLKSIFAKADVTREAQLVALLNRLLR